VAALVRTQLIFKSRVRLVPLAQRSLNRDPAVERGKAEVPAPVRRVLTNAATAVEQLRLNGGILRTLGLVLRFLLLLAVALLAARFEFRCRAARELSPVSRRLLRSTPASAFTLSGSPVGSLIPSVKPGRTLVELGAPSCSDAEILAILLGSGGRGYTALDAARALLDKYGTLASLMGQPLNEIAAVRGIKTVRAVRLAAVFEFCQRVLKEIDREA
jgi:hypothetical protein